MSARQLQELVQLDEAAQDALSMALDRLGLSARAYERVLKVARTIADLDGSNKVQRQHIAEAVSYRNLDRSTWGT